MSAPVTLALGGDGEALGFRGEVLHAVLSRAFAPGAPVELTITLAGEPLAIRGKTIGSKKRPDERFDVRMRLVSLRREDRLKLETLGG